MGTTWFWHKVYLHTLQGLTCNGMISFFGANVLTPRCHVVENDEAGNHVHNTTDRGKKVLRAD
jgi:hypothetical protein